MVIRDALHYENKINLLLARGETMNQKIINKCQRKLRKLQAGA